MKEKSNASALLSLYFLANAVLRSFASRPAFVRVSPCVRLCLALRSPKSLRTVLANLKDGVCRKGVDWKNGHHRLEKHEGDGMQRLGVLLNQLLLAGISFSLVSRYRRTAAIPARSWA